MNQIRLPPRLMVKRYEKRYDPCAHNTYVQRQVSLIKVYDLCDEISEWLGENPTFAFRDCSTDDEPYKYVIECPSFVHEVLFRIRFGIIGSQGVFSRD